MKVKITEEQKEILKVLVNAEMVALTAFRVASANVNDTKDQLWEEVRKMYPGAIRLDHPEDGDWTVLLGWSASEKYRESSDSK